MSTEHEAAGIACNIILETIPELPESDRLPFVEMLAIVSLHHMRRYAGADFMRGWLLSHLSTLDQPDPLDVAYGPVATPFSQACEGSANSARKAAAREVARGESA